ncbi:hypothetical protein HRbin17_00165 [bacterium HR17]|uniref:Uncharacterized protein n=1 Tax=Candidatus Fervidibacter japonicus TaxID=2035412 RepID=A0A2H5X914_9BACT|nr:hypothetical protein HRbin17_00165 [bacterium HR17]
MRRFLSSAAQKSRPPKNLQHSEGASPDAPLSLFGGSESRPPKNLQHSEGASPDAPLSLFGGSKEPPSD